MTSPTTRSDIELAARLRPVLVRTARRMRQEAGTDLSPSLAAALATIDRHGPLTPSRLADIERVRRPTATRMVARLEEQDLVLRTTDPGDGRVSFVSTSPAGRTLLKRIRGRKNVYLARRLRELSDEEAADLERAAAILERLLEEERA
jgi:DNA-binding MarR family transcriptional regulator